MRAQSERPDPHVRGELRIADLDPVFARAGDHIYEVRLHGRLSACREKPAPLFGPFRWRFCFLRTADKLRARIA